MGHTNFKLYCTKFQFCKNIELQSNVNTIPYISIIKVMRWVKKLMMSFELVCGHIFYEFMWATSRNFFYFFFYNAKFGGYKKKTKLLFTQNI